MQISYELEKLTVVVVAYATYQVREPTDGGRIQTQRYQKDLLHPRQSQLMFILQRVH